MFYLIYKITLLKGSLAGHYYYGQHRTKNINDNYAGSGRIISNYYKKYGKIKDETYHKEIISFCESIDELNATEINIINTLYKDDPKCLNLKSGGGGLGISEETRNKLRLSHSGKHQSEETKEKISKNNGMKNKEVSSRVAEKHKGIHNIISDEQKHKISETLKMKYKSGEIKPTHNITYGFKGHKHSEESKKKISENIIKTMSNPDVRQKMSKSKIGNKNAQGHKVSEETKEKMKPWKGYHWKKDPETGKRIFYKDE